MTRTSVSAQVVNPTGDNGFAPDGDGARPVGNRRERVRSDTDPCYRLPAGIFFITRIVRLADTMSGLALFSSIFTSERTCRRAQQAAVALYPLVVLLGVADILTSSGGYAVGGAFHFFVIFYFGVVPAAFIAALVVLVVNGLGTVFRGSVDWIGVCIASVVAVALPLMVAVPLGVEPFDGMPLPAFFALGGIGLVLGPVALALHLFGSSPWRALLRRRGVETGSPDR